MVSPAQMYEMDDERRVDERKTKTDVDILELLDAGNIADQLPKGCGAKLLTSYDDACSTMTDWLSKYERALRLAKLQPKEERKTFPFEGASTAMAPFVMEAMIDFNARTAPELAYSDNIVKAKIFGGQQLPEVPAVPELPPLGPEATPEQQQQDQMAQQQAQAAFQQAQAEQKQAQERIDTDKEGRAERVAEYSNYQLTELMPTWKQNQDKLLLSLPCVGTMYKETYFDDETQEVRSDLCYGNEIKFDFNYPTFEEAPDKYKELPDKPKNEVVELIRGECQWDIEESELSDDDDETYSFINAYTWVDIDDDGLKEPYLITIWKEKERCVYARPLFDEDTVQENDDGDIIKVEPVKRFTQYQFIPDPEGGPMGMGWGILLGPAFEEINTSIRQMHDAGTLQVLASNSGLIASDNGTGRGNRSQKGPIELAMGKLTPIQISGPNSLAQSVVQFPAAGPSNELFQLLGYMVDSLRRLTDASSQLDANANEAAALYLARLQQTLKRPNVITMRVYNCAAKEFKAIFALNHKHFSDDKYNRVIDAPQEYSMAQDFDPEDCDIRLVADPAQGSDIERIARAEAVLQNAKTEATPITDMRQATIEYYEVLGVKDVTILVPEPEGPDPMEAMMKRQQELEEAKEQMDAEFRDREQKLKERDQDLRERQQNINLKTKEQENMMKAVKEAATLSLQGDELEAKITEIYSRAMKNLADIGVDPVAGVKLIESQQIDFNPQAQ